MTGDGGSLRWPIPWFPAALSRVRRADETAPGADFPPVRAGLDARCAPAHAVVPFLMLKPTGVAMNTRLSLSARAAAMLALCLVMTPAMAQSPHEQATKELARKMPAGSVQACSLITRADVTKATGRDPYMDPEPAGQGGWICNVGIGELKVYSGPNSWHAWESTLKGFKKDKEPRIPAPAYGERAYFLYPKPDNQYQSNVAFLVAGSGGRTLALSLDAPAGKPAESMRPALESLMKTIFTRLR
jgi:hypothetical protein